MNNQFFEHPILNSPYDYPARHWELDAQGQPTQQITERRRQAEFITPTPKPKKRKGQAVQTSLLLDDEGDELSTQAQEYEKTASMINAVRQEVDKWRGIQNPNDWRVTPETARLLQHWRHHKFSGIRPFFCQVEAVETAIWLTEVVPQLGKSGEKFLEHLANANNDANPELMRLALKLATGAGKTTVMAMLIAWQTINAVRRPGGKKFTRGFLIAAPGLTIKDRLRVLQPNDPDSYYLSRELVPSDMMGDLERAKIVITNYHAFKLRERLSLSKGGRLLLQGRGGEERNFDEHGNPLGRPKTLLIDSEQLESGEALDDNFRGMASDEIERFRREIVERTGDPRQAENITDQDLLREVMNTVGKAGRLGDSIRCVVSVSMLTEGWDASTVTHVLGVRAFGTQLLCEQVIGRALRRQSYELNEEGLFNVEYADVLGIPFDFTAKPVVAPPQPPRVTIQVKAVRPDRDALEIRFPRVQGYRVELPEERLIAEFNADSVLELTPDLVGPSITRTEGIIGEGVNLSLVHTGDMRHSTLLMHLTKRLIYTKWRDPGEEPKLYLFGQLKRIAKQWLDTCLVCKGGTYPAQLMYQSLADMACERITAGITRALIGERSIKAVLDPYNPTGTTAHVNFNTSKKDRRQTDSRRRHINWIVLDSGWEGEFCRVAEAHPRVKAYVKNHNLGLEVPYRYGSEMRTYLPDFVVLVEDGKSSGPGEDGQMSDLLHLIVEVKGYRREDAKEKKATMETYWVPGVNNLKQYGRWAFAEFTEVWQMQHDFEAKVEAEFEKMIGKFVP